jgi:signal transduction histidine kinase
MMESRELHVSPRERVLLDLVKRDTTNAVDAFSGTTEASAKALGVARVSIWRLLPNAAGIECQDLYILDEGRHEHGGVLHARDYPAYFEALLENRSIPADDALTDPRTREFADSYLAPRGITSMMDVPIWHKGSLYGVVCHEHVGPPRHWRQEEVEFAGNLADVVAVSLEASERHAVKRRWASVMDAAAESIILMDRLGYFVQMSPRSHEIYEALGGYLSLRERQDAFVYRDLLGRMIPKDEWPGERTLRGERVHDLIGAWRRRDASFIGYYDVIGTPIFEAGDVERVVFVASNVTQEVQFNRLKAEFLAALAHELEMPVQTIRRRSDGLAAREDLDPQSRAKLEAIGRASTRIERLVGDAAELSNFSLGRPMVALEKVDLRRMVEQEVQRAARVSSRHHWRVAAPSPVELVLDHAKIERAIVHLLDNAVRFSPHGGQIDVQLAVQPAGVVLSVRDRGLGIPAHAQSRIFEPFFRAHAGTTHDYGGLGIGLHLVREIVRLHGGDVWFESTEGRGSTFYVRLKAELPG